MEADLRPVVLLLGPHLTALSGVSSHLRTLLGSPLAERYSLVHFQVGSEGRNEGRTGRLVRLLLGPWALARAIVARRAALVHVNTSLNPRAFWRDLGHLAVARACGARVLLQVHGGALPQDFFRGDRVLTALLRSALRHAGAIAVLARAELDAYRAFVPQQKVVVIPNAVDCAVAAARANAAVRQPSSPLRVVYVGRLAREKGLFELLHALHLTHLQGAAHHLTIAGHGPDEAALRNCVRTLGMVQHVAFAGAVRETARAELLAGADVFVLPSYSEGLPYALLEAMAAGVPVIATSVGAVPDVVEHMVHGLLVAPHDAQAIAQALQRLARESALLLRMGAACRVRIASDYSVEQLAQGFGRLYAELLSASG
jgi:glycosyltransferase involved in cell wall biosynthesis